MLFGGYHGQNCVATLVKIQVAEEKGRAFFCFGFVDKGERDDYHIISTTDH